MGIASCRSVRCARGHCGLRAKLPPGVDVAFGKAFAASGKPTAPQVNFQSARKIGSDSLPMMFGIQLERFSKESRRHADPFPLI